MITFASEIKLYNQKSTYYLIYPIFISSLSCKTNLKSYIFVIKLNYVFTFVFNRNSTLCHR